MKICILIIYSDNEDYQKMLEIQKEYLNFFKDEIIFYFCQMKNNISNEIEVDNNFIYVKGEEKLLNVLKKTIISMKYIIQKHDIDFLIRTNISTIVNIIQLKKIIHMLPKVNFYGGGHFLNLQWLSYENGIYDNSLFGTFYVQGTSIIFSKDIVENICNNMDKLRYDLIDDLALGVYISTYYSHILDYSMILSYELLSMFNIKENSNIKLTENYLFYRNRIEAFKSNEKRIKDIENMKNITNLIIKSK